MTDERKQLLVKHSQAIKAVLLEMAKSGEKRPKEGTLLGDAIKLYTTQKWLS